MQRKIEAARRTAFAMAVLASLGFGTSQALASPAAADECGTVPWSFPLYCPTPRDCDAECYWRGFPYGGFCHSNCCTCAY